jgi:hypothetical protein
VVFFDSTASTLTAKSPISVELSEELLSKADKRVKTSPLLSELPKSVRRPDNNWSCSLFFVPMLAILVLIPLISEV